MASRSRLLQCPELLAEVFSHLDPRVGCHGLHDTCAAHILRERQELRGTLAAAALSCRALTEHAQAVLWRRLDSVQPLLSILEFPNIPVTILRTTISPQSWRRFRTHTRHVKVLWARDWSAIHPSAWAFIARWCGPEPLLPNVEELSGLPINVRSPTTMMFISPKLRTLSLELRTEEDSRGRVQLLRDDPTAVYLLLDQIVLTAPRIRTLSIANRLPLSSSCYSPISCLENIEALYARDCVLNCSLLSSLGTQPLRSLAATVDMTDLPQVIEESEVEDEEYDPFDGCFRNLKHLTVRGTPKHIDLFLYNSTTCDLETIAVEFVSGAGQELVTRCIEDIADDALLGRPVLRELAIKYPYESHYDDEHKSGNAGPNTLRDASLVDVLSPALRISFLRKVTLEFHIIPALTDAGLLQMISAWPHLTTLHITPPRERFGSRVTLTSSVLVEFARRCPRLAELTLPEVPLAKVPAEKDMPLVGQRALRKLRVAFRDRDRQHVLYGAALFIDRLFPCLSLNPSFDEEEEPRGYGLFQMSWENKAEEEERTWRRIEEFLFAMQLGRRHREELRGVSY